MGERKEQMIWSQGLLCSWHPVVIGKQGGWQTRWAPLLLGVDGDEQHLPCPPGLCKHPVNPKVTGLGKPESTCRRVCQPFDNIGEAVSPLQCSDESLTLALGPRSHHLTQDVADTLTAPRMVLTPGGGGFVCRGTGSGGGHQKEDAVYDYSVTETCLQNQHCQELIKNLGQITLLPWSSVILCCQMRSLNKVVSRNSSNFKTLVIILLNLIRATVFDLVTVDLKHTFALGPFD